jgi:hypothetical protein
MGQGKKKKKRRITEKDLGVLEWVGRYGVVPRSAVSVWAKTGRSVTLDRERRLREAGLIEVHPALARSGALLTPTSLGLRLCGRSELYPPRVSLWVVRHAIVLAHVAARLELAGERLLSEREIAAAERLEGERIYSAEKRREERGQHRPDLVRLGEGVEAIEVELTNKAPRRLDDLMRAWGWALMREKIARVIYLCPPKTLRYVERSVERTGERGIVCQLLTLPNLKLPRPASQISGAKAQAVKGRRPDPKGVDGQAGAATVAARSGSSHTCQRGGAISR